MNKKFGALRSAAQTALLGALVVGGQAFAAADLTDINNAKTDILAYLAAMLGLAIAIWGVRKTMSQFSR